jgi:hypothetical protein
MLVRGSAAKKVDGTLAGKLPALLARRGAFQEL